MKIFTVVCHGNAKGLLDVTAETGARCSCLYNEPVDPGVYQAAPFLVEVNEEIKPWFASLTDPWGVYLITGKDVSFHEMRQHLRKFTYVKIPSQEVPVMFRFYDPRVFWDFTEIIDNWQLHLFLGDIELVASNYGELKQGHFSDRRELYPSGSKMKQPYLTLTAEQEKALDLCSEKQYIIKLVSFLKDWISNNYYIYNLNYSEILALKSYESLLEELAQKSLKYLFGIGVSDEDHIIKFLTLTLSHNYIQFTEIPEEWFLYMDNIRGVGFYKVIRLVDRYSILL